MQRFELSYTSHRFNPQGRGRDYKKGIRFEPLRQSTRWLVRENNPKEKLHQKTEQEAKGSGAQDEVLFRGGSESGAFLLFVIIPY